MRWGISVRSHRFHRSFERGVLLGLPLVIAAAVAAIPSLASAALPPGYCYLQCKGGSAKAPFDFRKKAATAGDPNTGAPLGATMKVPKSEGSSEMVDVPSKDFFDQMNSFEEWSAKECGESLTDPKSVVDVAGPCDTDRTKNYWTSSVLTAHTPSGQKAPGQTVIDSFFDLAVSPQQKKAKEEYPWVRRGGLDTAFKKCWPKDIGAGNKDTFAVSINGEVCADFYAPPIPGGAAAYKGVPPDSRTTLQGTAAAQASILGHGITVASAKARFHSPHGAAVQRSTSVYFLGMKAIDETSNGTDIKWDKNIDLGSVKQGISATFTIGPIPITIEAGATGKAGVKLMARLTDMWANGRASPYVDLAAYMSGYINAFIAQAGVDASMTLLQDILDLYGFAGVAVGNAAGKTQFVFTAQVAGENAIQALNGHADAFARIRVPKFLGWRWKTYRVNLFNWEGVKTSGFLFSYMLANQPIATFVNNVE